MCFIVCVLLCFVLYIALYVFDVAALWRNNKLIACVRSCFLCHWPITADCRERRVSTVTYYVSSGKLNLPTRCVGTLRVVIANEAQH